MSFSELKNKIKARSQPLIAASGRCVSRIWAAMKQAGKKAADGITTAARWSVRFAKRAARGTKRVLRRTTNLIMSMVNIYIRKKASRSAAEFAFNVVLTIFPLLICIHWLVSILHTNYDETIALLDEFVPPTALSILTDYLQYMSENSSKTMLFAGIVMLMAPSSAALRSLQGILNDIQNAGRRGGIWSFLLSFVFSIVFLLVIYVCMIIMFTGRRLLNFLVAEFGLADKILGWNWLRFLVLFFIMSLVLYLLYRFLPFSLRRPKNIFKGWVFPGVIFSAIALVAVSIIFSWFISLSTRYSLVYGSLTSVVIMMLWLYMCSNIIIIGGIINRVVNEYSRHFRALVHRTDRTSDLKKRNG